MPPLDPPLFMRPNPAPLPVSPASNRQYLACADKLRLYVLSWLTIQDKFTVVANDPSSDKVPTFLCLQLDQGELCTLKGNVYAAGLESYLLIGDHPIDEQALYRQALAQLRSQLSAEERARFAPDADEFHHRIHRLEQQLIRQDGGLFWLHNVNYPGLVMLAQNHFYSLSEAQISRWLDCQLASLAEQHGECMQYLSAMLQTWLFERHTDLGTLNARFS